MKRSHGIPALAGAAALSDRALAAAAVLLGLYFLGAFLYVAISRIGYPFALEWLEGGSYSQVYRVLTGQPLYAAPSMEYVAMIYPPLYYYVAAISARIVGLGFLPLRLVSLASTLGAMLVIFLLIRHENGNSLAAFLGASLFAATFKLTGNWFDIARVDMLSVFLVILGIFLFRLPSPRCHMAAGMAFGLACLTKQTQLISLVCVIAYSAIWDRRKLLTFALPALFTLAAAYFFLNRFYSGWFGFFVLRLALGSGEYVGFDPAAIGKTALGFWVDSVLLSLPVVSILVLISIAGRLRSAVETRSLYFFLACAVGMLGTSWAVIQVGGYKNDLVPAYAIIAVWFGIALKWLLEKLPSGSWSRVALLATCGLQFALLWYPPAPQIPSPRDRAAGNALVEQIRDQTGDVYVPFHPELALMAGKEPFASWSPMFQLEGNYGGGNIRAASRVKTGFARAMERQQFSLIILDQEPNWIWGDPERYYVRSDKPVLSEPDVFWPVTGWQTRPDILLLPARNP